jgi:hypothetical protein
MNVVGITGLAGSGKSTVANYLVEAHGYTRLSFAGPLKKMLRTLNPIMGLNPLAHSAATRVMPLDKVFSAYCEDELSVKDSEYGPEYRRLLQVLGTDCIRAVDPSFWVKAAVAQMTDEDGKYVFDDVRFPNEAEVIKEINPWGLWHVIREGQELTSDAHVSEQYAGHMGEFQSLYNITTKEFLYAEVDRALSLAFSDSAPLAA